MDRASCCSQSLRVSNWVAKLLFFLWRSVSWSASEKQHAWDRTVESEVWSPVLCPFTFKPGARLCCRRDVLGHASLLTCTSRWQFYLETVLLHDHLHNVVAVHWSLESEARVRRVEHLRRLPAALLTPASHWKFCPGTVLWRSHDHAGVDLDNMSPWLNVGACVLFHLGRSGRQTGPNRFLVQDRSKPYDESIDPHGRKHPDIVWHSSHTHNLSRRTWPRRQTYRSVLGVLLPVIEVDLPFGRREDGDVKQERKNTHQWLWSPHQRDAGDCWDRTGCCWRPCFLSQRVPHSSQEEGEKTEKENNANLELS